MKDKTTRMIIAGVVSIIILVSFYGIAIQNKEDTFVIASSVLAGLIIVLNMGFIFKNINQINSMKKKLEHREVNRINIHPLELFLIDRIWYHKKTSLGTNQLYAGVMYSINRGELVISGGVLKFGDVVIEELPKYSRLNIELAFLSVNECKQSNEIKLEKLKKIQDAGIGITIENVKNNIDENLKERGLIYELIHAVKEEFFVNIEGNFAALFMLLTYVVAASEFILALSHLDGGGWQFYTSLICAIVLIGTITSSYRERVTIQEHKMADISIVLNYIQKLSVEDTDNSKLISLYALGRLEKNNDIVNIFL